MVRAILGCSRDHATQVLAVVETGVTNTVKGKKKDIVVLDRPVPGKHKVKMADIELERIVDLDIDYTL